MFWKTFDWKSQKAGRRGEIINKASYRCAFCKGTGFMPSRQSARCPACSGARNIRVPFPSVICAYCNGEGRSFLNKTLTCIICKGKGIVSVSSENIGPCPACKCRGRASGVDLPCMTCKGKGVVPKKITA